jgi:hypothetical protein
VTCAAAPRARRRARDQDSARRRAAAGAVTRLAHARRRELRRAVRRPHRRASRRQRSARRHAADARARHHTAAAALQRVSAPRRNAIRSRWDYTSWKRAAHSRGPHAQQRGQLPLRGRSARTGCSRLRSGACFLLLGDSWLALFGERTHASSAAACCASTSQRAARVAARVAAMLATPCVFRVRAAARDGAPLRHVGAARRPAARRPLAPCAAASVSADRMFRTTGEADVHLWGVEHLRQERTCGVACVALRSLTTRAHFPPPPARSPAQLPPGGWRLHLDQAPRGGGGGDCVQRGARHGARRAHQRSGAGELARGVVRGTTRALCACVLPPGARCERTPRACARAGTRRW